MIVFYWWEEVDGYAGGSRSEGGRRWIWVDTARRLHKLLTLGINTDTARRVPTMLTCNFE